MIQLSFIENPELLDNLNDNELLIIASDSLCNPDLLDIIADKYNFNLKLARCENQVTLLYAVVHNHNTRIKTLQKIYDSFKDKEHWLANHISKRMDNSISFTYDIDKRNNFVVSLPRPHHSPGNLCVWCVYHLEIIINVRMLRYK